MVLSSSLPAGFFWGTILRLRDVLEYCTCIRWAQVGDEQTTSWTLKHRVLENFCFESHYLITHTVSSHSTLFMSSGLTFPSPGVLSLSKERSSFNAII